MLSGKKTYAIAGMMLALGIAKSQGWIDAYSYEQIMAFLVPGAVWTMRDGIKKAEKKD